MSCDREREKRKKNIFFCVLRKLNHIFIILIQGIFLFHFYYCKIYFFPLACSNEILNNSMKDKNLRLCCWSYWNFPFSCLVSGNFEKLFKWKSFNMLHKYTLSLLLTKSIYMHRLKKKIHTDILSGVFEWETVRWIVVEVEQRLAENCCCAIFWKNYFLFFNLQFLINLIWSLNFKIIGWWASYSKKMYPAWNTPAQFSVYVCLSLTNKISNRWSIFQVLNGNSCTL